MIWVVVANHLQRWQANERKKSMQTGTEFKERIIIYLSLFEAL